MYCWGSNPEGHFGGGFEGDSHVPILTETVSFVSITSGSRHAFGVTEEGHLYACGANESGQLGLSFFESKNHFTLIPLQFKVKQVACGWAHTLLLTEYDEIFICGDNKKGQLGLGETIPNVSSFAKLKCNEKVIQVTCGVWSSFAVLESGNVLFWGQFRQLKSEICWLPVLLENMERISKLAVGHKHILTMSFDGAVKGYGCNKYGQIEVDSSLGPVRGIFAGWNHSIIWLKSDGLHLFGKNDHNQLAHHDKSCRKNIFKLDEQIVDVAVGSDHAMLITSKKLLIWGWNEHGILGQNHTEQLFGPPTELDFNLQKIKRIFCGPVSCFITTHFDK